MNLVIDASVAAKWLFSERYSDEAQLLLSSQYLLLAPDFVLVEIANVIWKKLRRSEVSSTESYVEVLAHLTDILVLRPLSELVTRAATLALQLDHPVYDCLYLTCAMEYAAPLITADEELLETAASEIPNIDVWHIGHSNFSQRIAEEG